MREHGFLDQQRVFDSGYGVDRHYWKGHFVSELPDELIEVLLARMTALGRPPGTVLIESLHGAPKDVDPASAALGYRGAAFNVTVMATWQEPGARRGADRLDARDRGRDRAMVGERGILNYMQADEPLERVRAAFGEGSFDRLRALKGLYDPGNVLRRNQNIPPPATR